MTGSPSSSWVSTRPCRPRRPSPDSSSAALVSRAASHAATSGASATTGASTGRGLSGLDQTVVTGTRTTWVDVTGLTATGELTPAILAPRHDGARAARTVGPTPRRRGLSVLARMGADLDDVLVRRRPDPYRQGY